MLTCCFRTSLACKLKYAQNQLARVRENLREEKTQVKNYPTTSTAWHKKKKFILEIRLTLLCLMNPVKCLKRLLKKTSLLLSVKFQLISFRKKPKDWVQMFKSP
jgi:hypothetical protein